MHARTVVSTIISITRWSTSIDTDIRLTIVCRFARTYCGTIRDTSIVNTDALHATHHKSMRTPPHTYAMPHLRHADPCIRRNCLAHGTSPSPQDRTCAENRSRTSAHSAARSDDSCGQPMPSLLRRNGSHEARCSSSTARNDHGEMRCRRDIRLDDSMRSHCCRLRSCSLSASA